MMHNRTCWFKQQLSPILENFGHGGKNEFVVFLLKFYISKYIAIDSVILNSDEIRGRKPPELPIRRWKPVSSVKLL